MFVKPKLTFNDLWKIYYDDELYAVLIPNGYSMEDIEINGED